MEKISVEVLVPATGGKYDFLLPSSMNIGVARTLIVQAVSEHEPGALQGRESMRLGAIERRSFLDEQQTLEKAGIQDGTVLILV
jgi:hypothetical protein